MSILGAMYAAVSGLNANSNALGIISDNIANANTIGYKDTTTDFSSLVTDSGAHDYSPGGVTTMPLYNIAQQGAIQSASSATDLAISGGGFFVVNSNAAGVAGTGTTSFTRAGNFTVDANGNLVNAAGLYLQGQILTPAQSAAIAAGGAPTLSGTTLAGLQTINVNSVSETADPTANVTLEANLPANASQPENDDGAGLRFRRHRARPHPHLHAVGHGESVDRVGRVPGRRRQHGDDRRRRQYRAVQQRRHAQRRGRRPSTRPARCRSLGIRP